MSGARAVIWGMIALTAAAAVALALDVTRIGPAVSPDSTIYFEAAENLIAGNGLFVTDRHTGALVPLNHYPPFYSMVLALVSTAGFSLETSARLLSAVCFGINVALLAKLVSEIDGRSLIPGAAAAVLAAAAPDIVLIHSHALSEPLFLTFTLGAACLVQRYRDNASSRVLLLAAILIGFSVSTRFVGAATLAAIALIILLQAGTWRRRIVHFAVFTVIALIPQIAWALRNLSYESAVTDRRVVFHLIPPENALAAVSTAFRWLAVSSPVDLLRVPASIATAAVITMVIWAAINALKDRELLGRMLVPLLITAANLSLLIFTALFIDVDTVFDMRTMIVVRFMLIAAFIAGAFRLLRGRGDALARTAAGLFILLTLSAAWRTSAWAREVRTKGQWYTSVAWKNSPTVARLAEIAPDAYIVSNAHDLIRFRTGKKAMPLPATFEVNSGLPNKDFEAQISEMRRRLGRENGYVVFFKGFEWRPAVLSEAEAISLLGLKPIFSAEDGTLYQSDKR